MNSFLYLSSMANILLKFYFLILNMLESDAEGFREPGVPGGSLPSTHWGDWGAAAAVLSSSSWSAVWNRCDATLESILWEAWGETRAFLCSVLPVFPVWAAGTSELTLLLLLMLSLFSLGPALGFWQLLKRGFPTSLQLGVAGWLGSGQWTKYFLEALLN